MTSNSYKNQNYSRKKLQITMEYSEKDPLSSVQLNEIISVDNLSTARGAVAQTMIEKIDETLWGDNRPTADLVAKSEAARRIYRKIVIYSPWHGLENPESAPKIEAIRRNEAYLSYLAFKGCALETGQLPPIEPISFASLPRDILIEERYIQRTLRDMFGDSSPMTEDFA